MDEEAIKRIVKQHFADRAYTEALLNQSREAKAEEIKENKKASAKRAILLIKAVLDFEKDYYRRLKHKSHNHTSRDVKPKGKCPACDEIWQQFENEARNKDDGS